MCTCVTVCMCTCYIISVTPAKNSTQTHLDSSPSIALYTAAVLLHTTCLLVAYYLLTRSFNSLGTFQLLSMSFREMSLHVVYNVKGCLQSSS